MAGQFSIGKTNAFRMLTDQPLLSPRTNKNQNAAAYCQNMVNIQPAKLQQDAAAEAGFTSPVPAVGNNLATFMGARLSRLVRQHGLRELRPDQPGHGDHGR